MYDYSNRYAAEPTVPSLESWLSIPLAPRIREMIWTPSYIQNETTFALALEATLDEIRKLEAGANRDSNRSNP